MKYKKTWLEKECSLSLKWLIQLAQAAFVRYITEVSVATLQLMLYWNEHLKQD